MLGDLKPFQQTLLSWYRGNRRELPWRVAAGARPPPYHVLLSEAMLQQTQVATVVPYFTRFVERFPTLADLAGAELQDVLRLWQGLGYYSRARNLHRCAKVIVEGGGEVPCEVAKLLELPGIGRYTAGAIASLAFDVPAPILDGNVMRVLCRIDKVQSDPREKATAARLWERAEEILPKKHAGDFNSALMELGATVCTPKSPTCLLCPVQKHCEALAAGVVERIPTPRKTKATPLEKRTVLCIHNGGHYLIEQRPAKGRWAALWQFVTFATNGRSLTAEARQRVGVKVGVAKPLGKVKHALTHRQYEFEAYLCELKDRPRRGQTWVNLVELSAYPLSKPQLTIAGMLGDLSD